MHEMGIANSVLDAVRQESASRGGVRVSKVALRIGQLAAVDPESLRFCLDALIAESDLEPLAVEFEFCSRRGQCLECGETAAAGAHFDWKCPRCGSAGAKFTGGNELEFAYMEIEDA